MGVGMAMKTRGQREHVMRKPRHTSMASAPAKHPHVFGVSRAEVRSYDRKIAARSPRMSGEARQFLAQMRANPGYRAVMRDLADK